MASSRRRRDRRNRNVGSSRAGRRITSWGIPDTAPVIEQVHFGKKTLSSRDAVRRRQRQQAQISRIRKDLRRRALAKANSLSPNALKRELRETVEKVIRPGCRPRPDSKKAGRSPKRKRGKGAGAQVREFIPWCRS